MTGFQQVVIDKSGVWNCSKVQPILFGSGREQSGHSLLVIQLKSLQKVDKKYHKNGLAVEMVHRVWRNIQ